MGTVTMPKMGDTMEEGTIVTWLKKEGDTVKEGDVIAEIETEKAAIEIEAFESGILTSIIVKEGQTVPVGAPIAEIGGSGEKPSASASPAQPRADALDNPEATPPAPEVVPAAPSAPEKTTPPPPSSTERVKASPLARRIAQENSVDLHQIRGTGPGGRIVREDVDAFLKDKGHPSVPTAPETVKTPGPSSPAPVAVPPGAVWAAGPALSRMRQVIARRLTESKQQVPHFYVTMDIDMKAAMALRAQLNERGEGFAKLSPNDLVVKAVADSLRAQAAMRQGFGGDKVLQTEQVNVGVAVALPDGLIVPVVRQADQKSLTEIAQEVRVLADKARAGKLMPDEYAGGTFTVSNLGMFGVEDFSAIINPPEPGILAVSAIQEAPVAVDGRLVVGTRMKVTLSADHRAVDGAVGAQFLQEVKRRLENPLLLLK